MTRAAIGEAMQRRVRVTLLAILVVLYGAAAAQAPLLAHTRGSGSLPELRRPMGKRTPTRRLLFTD